MVESGLVTVPPGSGERLGILCYAFLANQVQTTNRPDDEHRFQVKYGSKDGKLHRLWRDPFGLYTTLFVGINPHARRRCRVLSPPRMG